MRSGIALMIAFTMIVLYGGPAVADGPQFTGLLNVYVSTSSGFDEMHNSLARMDLNGPVAGTALRLDQNYSDIVAAPDGSAYYAILRSSNVYRINPGTLLATQMSVEGILVGETWDSARNRLVVATLEGAGFLHGYSPASNQWNVISSLQQQDLRSIAYRPSDDLIYALPNIIGSPMTEILKYSAATGARVGTVSLPQSIPEHVNGTDLSWQMMLASDGQLAVIAPRRLPTSGGGTVPGSWLYLINPDTGALTYSAPLPVPEPGVASIITVVVMMLRVLKRR
jgi:hypothetical protein